MKNHGNWRLFTREWGIRVGLTGLTLLWLTLMAASWADAAENSRGSNYDEYSFSWLDPDKRIYVLQNRRYVKAQKLILSLMTGVGTSNPYRTTYNLDPRIAFYFSEALGIEFFYTKTVNKTNTTFNQLQQASPTTWPVVREIRSQMGVLGHWVPWYAKINVFNKILYLDWYFSGGVGTLQTALEKRTIANGPSTYTDQNFTAFYFGTGHNYYLSDSFSIRLDLLGAAYNAELGPGSTAKAWYSNYNFNIGLGWRI